MPSESGVVARCKNISCPIVAGFTCSMRGVNPRASGQIRSGRAAKNIPNPPGSPQAPTKQRVHAAQGACVHPLRSEYSSSLCPVGTKRVRTRARGLARRTARTRCAAWRTEGIKCSDRRWQSAHRCRSEAVAALTAIAIPAAFQPFSSPLRKPEAATPQTSWCTRELYLPNTQ